MPSTATVHSYNDRVLFCQQPWTNIDLKLIKEWHIDRPLVTRKELDIDGTFIGCRIRDLKPDSENVPCYFLVLERWHLFVHSRIIEIQCLRIAGEEAGETGDSISI
jgi:hypothetical protein